jgi:hypothetical protein
MKVLNFSRSCSLFFSVSRDFGRLELQEVASRFRDQRAHFGFELRLGSFHVPHDLAAATPVANPVAGAWINQALGANTFTAAVDAFIVDRAGGLLGALLAGASLVMNAPSDVAAEDM